MLQKKIKNYNKQTYIMKSNQGNLRDSLWLKS